MRQVKSQKNKSTELRLIQVFKEQHITGWRRNYRVKGHPDFVFPKQRVAVFVDGCFWHGHDCRNTRPSDNQEYWQKKRGKVPEYTTIGHDGPDHEQVFHVTVTLGGKVYGPADGKNKKHAEQNAAKLALIHLGLEPNDGKKNDRE